MKEKNFEEEIEAKCRAETYFNTVYNSPDNVCDIELAIRSTYEKAFLAGLKAGKPKWHKDLPTEDIRLAIIEVEDCGYILCNYRNGFWYDDNSGAICAEWITNNIVCWKEIVLPELPNETKEKNDSNSRM